MTPRPAPSPGELRHEQCRYGWLTSGEVVDFFLTGPVSVVVAIPMCSWTPKEVMPPHITRYAGGDVDFARDCAVCPCFERFEASTA